MGELWEARAEAEAAGLSRGQLLQILNSGFGNLFVTDSRGRICYANDSVARDMGLARQELLTMRIQDIVEQELADTFRPWRRKSRWCGRCGKKRRG